MKITRGGALLACTVLLLVVPGAPVHAESTATPERAVLYEEVAGKPNGNQFPGTVTWRVTTTAPEPGAPAEPVVRADIQVPDRGMKVSWVLRRNDDPTLHVSHRIDIAFALRADDPHVGVHTVPGNLMKEAEGTRGAPLAGLAVPVTTNVFLLGLSSAAPDDRWNMKLLRGRRWVDVPIIYSDGRRAILSFDKGPSGQRAFDAAFATWERTPAGSAGEPAAAPAPPSDQTAPRQQTERQARQPADRRETESDASEPAVLYEEESTDPNGKRFSGRVVWRLEPAAPETGGPAETIVRADVDVPERGMKLAWVLHRNDDRALSASHRIDVAFTLRADDPHRGIQNVPGIMMKPTEQAHGVPLAGTSVKVTRNVFRIGLSAAAADVRKNVALFEDNAWMDVPIFYNDGHRALLAIGKGPSGRRAFDAAFSAWDEAATAADQH
jgi:hypothetical protein